MRLDKFINRPVLSTVISILLVILGFIGLATLPITQYPDIAPPTVSVSATYTGANAQAVLNSVISPLEDQINGVENMMYMQSTATNNGSAPEPCDSGTRSVACRSNQSRCDYDETSDFHVDDFLRI